MESINLKYLSKDDRRNKDIVKRAVIENYKDIVKRAVIENYEAFAFADISLKEDLNYIKDLMDINLGILEYTNILNDFDKCILLVDYNGLALKYLSSNLKNNIEIVKKAVYNNPNSIEFAGFKAKNDFSIMFHCVKSNGLLLKFASDILKSDIDLVKCAVTNNGLALQFASDYIKEIHEIVNIAVKNNGFALEFAKLFQDDFNIVKEAVSNNGWALKFASNRLARNEYIVLKALSTYNEEYLNYYDEQYSYDKIIYFAPIYMQKEFENLTREECIKLLEGWDA